MDKITKIQGLTENGIKGRGAVSSGFGSPDLGQVLDNDLPERSAILQKTCPQESLVTRCKPYCNREPEASKKESRLRITP